MSPRLGDTLAAINLATVALLVAALLFAATTLLLRLRNARKAARWRRVEAAWTPPLVEVLAGDRPPEELAARVAPADVLLFADFLLRFARRLRGAERGLLLRLARPCLPAVARRLASRNPERRARAVQTLALLGPETYGAELVRALDDRAPLVAMVAARALAAGRDPGHGAAVLAHLGRFGEWSPRYLASMLAGMGPEAGPALVDLLADSAAAPRLRAVAGDTLRLLKDLAAPGVAAAVLRAGQAAGAATDRELAASCLRLVAALGRPEHLESVRPLLASADDVIRAAATQALAQLAAGDAADTAALARAASDPSPWVALEGARGLRRLGALATLDALAASGGPGALVARQVRWEAAA